MEKFVITIAREYCSGGQKIGTRLAEELGVNCYNSEMFRLVSKNENMKDDAVAHDDRIKDTSLFDVAKAIYTDPLPSPEVDDVLTTKIADDDMVYIKNIYDYQSEIITELAHRESCIIVGRCANYILKDNPNAINVFVHAPIGFKMKRAASRHYMPENELRNYLAKVDERKADYYFKYTGCEWTDIKNYDLSLDTSKLGISGCVDMIKKFLEIKLNK
ncbi:MAG: cytidylate kinase-like family protein [Eubacterium sp.]|nr:cytidylate kinase-like family protein [Eubacterium sp.]MBR1773077.1 cytidylate kinase-like family protein [Eubacterium sp.]